MCYLFARGIPIIYKMFAIHIVMATYWIFSVCNGPLVWCAAPFAYRPPIPRPHTPLERPRLASAKGGGLVRVALDGG